MGIIKSKNKNKIIPSDHLVEKIYSELDFWEKDKTVLDKLDPGKLGNVEYGSTLAKKYNHLQYSKLDKFRHKTFMQHAGCEPDDEHGDKIYRKELLLKELVDVNNLLLRDVFLENQIKNVGTIRFLINYRNNLEENINPISRPRDFAECLKDIANIKTNRLLS